MSLNFSGIKLPRLTVDQKSLFSETYKNDPCLVSLLMNEFESDEKGCPFFSGLTPRKFAKCDWHLLYKETGSYLLNKYENRWRPWEHSEQRKVLEKAIRLFDKADKADHTDAEVALGKGKAYLYRSRIIRPKGFTIPGKKQDTLKKALEFCKNAKEKQQPYPDADHFAGLVALEVDRCHGQAYDDETDFTGAAALEMDRYGMKSDDLEQILKDAVSSIDDPFKAYSDHQKIIEFYQMRLRLEEVTKGLYDNPVLGKIFDFDKPGLELERLKVAVCNPNVSADLRFSCHIRLLDSLRCHLFSHHLWEDTVRWLVRLHDKENDFWQEFALDLWEAAEEISGRTSSLHLRWYWSRQRDLYDLAFLAALKQDKIEMAAQVADSVKSRPALTWQAMEQMPELKEEVEQYAQALAGDYIKMKDLKNTRSSAPNTSSFLSLELPETEAFIVQFYLVHLKGFKRGYVLIYDGKIEKWSESVEDFDFKPIWNTYLQWQTIYLELPPGQREKSATHLKALCLALGKQLDFLFKHEENRDMVFVPHDFLHRVPVHGAMLDEKTVLLGKFNCMYLPALSYADRGKEFLESKPVLLQHYDKSDKEWKKKSKRFDNLMKKNIFDKERSSKSASSDYLLEIIGTPPSMLAVRCHGKADAVNPFFSSLKLEDDLTLLTLALTQKTLSGMRVFFGACETDLIPPLDSPLDEHISMAAIFLDKGVHAVIGTMWEVKDKNVLDLIGKLAPFEELSGLQRDDAISFYRRLCFKVYAHK